MTEILVPLEVTVCDLQVRLAKTAKLTNQLPGAGHWY